MDLGKLGALANDVLDSAGRAREIWENWHFLVRILTVASIVATWLIPYLRRRAARQFLPPALIHEVVKKDLRKAAKADRVLHFYEGEAVKWDIIAAGADVERSQRGELLTLLSGKADGLQMVCVVGESASGKSTLVRRVGAELHLKSRSPVLEVLAPGQTETWGGIRQYIGKVRKRVYAILDDPFRDDDVIDQFRRLEPDLNLTILISTRPDEFARANRLPCRPIAFQLAGPTEDERLRILAKLGELGVERPVSKRDLARLSRATEFMALMIELLHGKDLIQAIRDSIEKLRKDHEVVYEAHSYVAFCSQYDIAMPESLLRNIGSGRFHGLLNLRFSYGYIHEDPAHPGHVRGRHALFESVAFEQYHRSPESVIGDLLRAAAANDQDHRMFVCRLIIRLHHLKPEDLAPILPDLPARLAPFWKKAVESGQFWELVLWRASLGLLELLAEAQQCEDALITLIPGRDEEWLYHAGICKKRGEPEKAYAMARAALRTSPNTIGARVALLTVAAGVASPSEAEEILEEAWRWLASHLKDYQVRVSFLTFLTSVRSPVGDGVTPQVLRETTQWVAANPGVRSMRAALLRLTKARGTNEDWKAIGDVFLEVLSRQVREDGALLTDLVARRELGSASDKALTRLVDRPVNDIVEMLEGNTDGLVTIANRLRDSGNLDKAGELFQCVLGLGPDRISSVLKTGALYGYGLLLMRGTDYPQALDQFRAVLAIFPLHHEARVKVALCLSRLAESAPEREAAKYRRQAEEELRRALAGGAADFKHPHRFPLLLLQRGEIFLSWGRLRDAVLDFEQAVQKARRPILRAYLDLGKAYAESGDRIKAKEALDRACELVNGDMTALPQETRDLLQQLRAEVAG